MCIMTDYRRQTVLLDQQRLLDSSVTVIGSGPIANYTLCFLAGLGIGRIKILTQDKVTSLEQGEFLIGKADLGRQKADCLEERLSNINPAIRVKGRSISSDIAFLGRPHVVIEATNDQRSKKAVAAIFPTFRDRYEECSKLILASGDDNSCHIAVNSLKEQETEGRILRRKQAHSLSSPLQERYKGKRQGALTSCIAASIVVDEVRKTLHPIERDVPLETAVTFNRKTLEYHLGMPPLCLQQQSCCPKRRPTRALIVGAGGIGTYVALNLAFSGIDEIHIYDPDTIEPHNLNRQLLYYGKSGEKKAATLAQRISAMIPDAHLHAHDITFGEEEGRRLQQKEFDIIFSCVDSFASRQLLSSIAVKSHTPLVDGSVSTFDACVDAYVPGATPCLDCRHDYASLLALDGRPMSCAQQSANIVMPNAMAAAMMVASGLSIIDGAIHKPFATKRFIYASQRRDAHKFMWAPFTAEKDTTLCGCLEGRR